MALEQARRFLRPLERDGLIDAWTDTRIETGEDWHSEIDEALERAGAAVLLVSQDFLDSEFIYREELPRLVAAAEAGGLTLIPVFLSPSLVDEIEIPFTDSSGEERRVKLSKYQGYGTPAKPLSELIWSDRERIYAKLARRLKDLGGSPAAAVERPADQLRAAPRTRARWRPPSGSWKTASTSSTALASFFSRNIPSAAPLASLSCSESRGVTPLSSPFSPGPCPAVDATSFRRRRDDRAPTVTDAESKLRRGSGYRQAHRRVNAAPATDRKRSAC